ncbi:FAD-dependent oxidoreductase [Thalassobaculum sp. OXR-137]|uniref:FAD-dependent oxidoreductase n=1 Tax=Thalassobaculum sp. OXR-137 TaxID=3100173 RepID=UPI002AC8C354|nr:FAD-dependent oxidoreductase [Thalassobaculum sp. OXR-137]WPZ32554.1 FAD-dependent oxidoreductase [Thalassobaculum sp. OXR-137]
MLQDRYTLAFREYPYGRCADQEAWETRAEPVRHPVVIVGGGPVGMTAALDLGLKGVPVLVLDDHEGIGMGSRAICIAKRSLEIADRLGCGAELVDRGVVWNLGKVFHRDRKVFEFNLLPEAGHRYPAFINLQQPYFEKALVDRLRLAQAQGAPVEIRGRNRVEGVAPGKDGARLEVLTPDGPYSIDADWVIACDGAASPVRSALGLGFEGRVFEDSFLIADVKMDAPFPTERRFWFDPPFKSGASALLHRQPDNVWRLDFQIGWHVDRETELRDENVRARIDEMLGPDIAYEVVWKSIYTFQCRRMTRFRHGRVLFAGDSAHQVSPFGARGANSGVQDVDNLAWKLKLVLEGRAPDSLLDSYAAEREAAADENILNSTRATDFITPKSQTSKLFRDAVLELSGRYPFARPLVNSGRLSVPCSYDGSALNGEDALPGGPARSRPGSPCPDVPLGDGFLLDRLDGRFHLLTVDAEAPDTLEEGGVAVARLALSASDDPSGALAARYLGEAGAAVYLIRPDQHVAARWPAYDARAVRLALRRAIGRD